MLYFYFPRWSWSWCWSSRKRKRPSNLWWIHWNQWKKQFRLGNSRFFIKKTFFAWECVWHVRHTNNNHITITSRTKLSSSQEMAKHLKKDPQSLLFCLEQGGGKLTGKEMMGDLEGARIVVTRLFWSCTVMCFQPNTVSFVKPKISIICHLQHGNRYDFFPKPYEIWPCCWEVFLLCVFNLMLHRTMLVKPIARLSFVGVFSSNMVRTKGDGGAARTVASKV